ncbi:MAG: hypothetical protein ABIB11_00100 [Candidatus Omnitrophota bacterium]
MGLQKKISIKSKQREKRRKRRLKLSKKGKNPDEFFTSGIYINRRLV